MNEQWPYADDIARLVAIRDRTRELVRGRQWLRQSFQQAFADFQRSCDRRSAECESERRRALETSRRVLASGEFGEANVAGVRFEGLCPARLARQIDGKDPRDLSSHLRKKSAAAALAALDRHFALQSSDTSDEQKKQRFEEERVALEAETHVRFAWTVFPPSTPGWQEPRDPRSLDRADLGAWSDADYRMIALYHLGGLADVGAARPLVPRPTETGDLMRDAPAYAAWQARLPVRLDGNGADESDLSPPRLPPELAEQMFAAVSEWVAAEEDTSAEPPAVRLWRALGCLRGALGDASSFTELWARRVERRRSRQAMIEAIGRGPFQSLADLASATEPLSRLLESSVPDEPADYLYHLADVLDEADRFCRDAIIAISLGGAQKVDHCVSPGAATASLAWDVRIQRTQKRLAKLRWWLWLPSAVVQEDLRGVQDDCAWLEQAIAELQAAERVPKAKDEQSGEKKRFAHAPDFTWIIWCGQRFTLLPGLQADAMRYLWAAWERGDRKDGCGLSEESLRKLIDCNRERRLRLSMVFRDRKDIWGKVIRRVDRGVFALFSI